MRTTSKANVALLAKLCSLKGITDVVVSPGSRNAPISIAMNRQEGLDCHVVIDERSAAYFALGMAMKQQRCVATVCTSGTAVLNQAPAVAEAFYQHIPLLVISADRPGEWIDQDDCQTIHQNGCFGLNVKASFSIDADESHTSNWAANRIINQAINCANSVPKGPVHLNISIDNPLYDTLEQETDFKDIPCFSQPEQLFSSSTLCKYQKILVVAGFMLPNKSLCHSLNLLAEKGVTVLAENISNIYGDKIIGNVEPTLQQANKNNDPAPLTPDLAIVIGGSIVSKSLKQFLRTSQPKELWRIGQESNIIDTFKCLGRQIKAEPENFFNPATNFCIDNVNYSFQSLWLKLSSKASQQPVAGSWCDSDAVLSIINSLPPRSILHLSNGTSVRNGQATNNTKGIEFYSNRGTSGIDGCLSTALGCAKASHGELNTLITGDLCFFYDSNALWQENRPGNLKVFIINNNGGGIFSKMIGPSKNQEYQKFFITPHNASAEGICSAFNTNYLKVSNKEELSEVLDTVFSNKQLTVIEVML